MKRVFGWGVLLGALGCVGSMTEAQLGARERFSRQYRCPESSVQVEQLGAGAVRAVGCRRAVTYQCESVYSMEDTVRCIPERPQ